MELSEAIEIAKKFIDRFNFVANNQSKLWDNVEGMEAGAVLSRTLETLLKALDNSISKDEVRKKIEELELLKKALPIRTEIPRYIDYLQELLGEELLGEE